MIDFDYAAPEMWHSRILGLQMRAEPHKIGGVVYVPESASDSRWRKLFGTPERVARTIADISERVNLDGIGGDYAALLEWMEGGAE